ncbi:MAG TPA: GNAT family N-acetyltransferase [Candidatus Margulisiibacteriota bacterium]|nr:GNAT family N-acetyltransferase [Candidatus Margulisiibacteriota bacterium]
MNGLYLRDARPSDRSAIEAITLAAYQQYAAAIPAYWEAYRQNILATLADVQTAEQIVAERAISIVGTVLLYPAGTVIDTPLGKPIRLPSPEVRLLAVEPAARRQGVGGALMHECSRRARASGARVLTLHTADFMQAAIRLYERFGFVRAAELDFEPAPGALLKGYRLRLDDTQ